MNNIRKTKFFVLLAALVLVLAGSAVPARAAVASKLTVKAGETGQLSLPRKLTLSKSLITEKAKERADYVRTNGFRYGDAQLNPAFNDSEKLVSCDRYVQWVFYDLGFHDLPELRGLWVSWPDHPEYDLETWCINHNFKKVKKIQNVKPGDVVFVGQNTSKHVFILGNSIGNGAWERYDCGNDAFIQAVQPQIMPIEDLNLRPDLPFRYAYRIVAPEVTWSSSDESVASVSADGTVTGINKGTCKVTAKSAIAKKVYTITVKPSVEAPGKPTFTPSRKFSVTPKTFTITTSTVVGADGFEICYSLKNSMVSSATMFVSEAPKAVRVVVKAKKSGKRYYIKVRAYKNVNGEKLFGPWSDIKSIKSR